MKNESDIYERAFQLSCRVMKMEQALSKRRVNRNSINQLVNAATSIGSNLEEAKGAHRKADFHLKVRISLKEARESHYWLRLLAASGVIRAVRLTPLMQEANEIVTILTTIAKKSNPRNPSPRDSPPLTS